MPWHFSESVRSAGPESPRSTQTPRSSPLFIARQLRVDIRFSARGSVLPRGESIRADKLASSSPGRLRANVTSSTISGGARQALYFRFCISTKTGISYLSDAASEEDRKPQSHMACVENLVVWTHSFGDIRANRQKRPSLTQFPFLGGVLITSEQL